MKQKRITKKQIKQWEEADYQMLLAHPAIDLLRLLPHTKEYRILCLLEETYTEVFDAGYAMGSSDNKMVQGQTDNKIREILDGVENSNG